MKTQSPEYLRVREEIAKTLLAEYNRMHIKDAPRIADSILAIKEIAILADDQSLPDILAFKGQVKRILIQANFKRMVE